MDLKTLELNNQFINSTSFAIQHETDGGTIDAKNYYKFDHPTHPLSVSLVIDSQDPENRLNKIKSLFNSILEFIPRETTGLIQLYTNYVCPEFYTCFNNIFTLDGYWFGLRVKDKFYICPRYMETKSKYSYKREEMPQIEGWLVPKFLEFLSTMGVTYTEEIRSVDSLFYTQSHLNMNKVQKKIETLQKYSMIFTKPFLADQEGYMMDSHHVHLARKLLGMDSLKTIIINTSIANLMLYARQFVGTNYETIKESKKMKKSLKTFIEDISTEPKDTKPKKQVDIEREKQKKEKEDLADKQERELEVARERDFRSDEQKRKQEKAKKQTT